MADEKLRSQTEFYVSEGVMFQSLRRGLLEGIIWFSRSAARTDQPPIECFLLILFALVNVGLGLLLPKGSY
jgi:hypothetical protein